MSPPPLSTEAENVALTLTDIPEQSRVCLSHVHVRESTLSMAGQGLFASVPFSAGDVMSVSPTIAVSISDIEPTLADTVLANYVYVSGDPHSAEEGVALVPLGVQVCNCAPYTVHRTSYTVHRTPYTVCHVHVHVLPVYFSCTPATPVLPP